MHFLLKNQLAKLDNYSSQKSLRSKCYPKKSFSKYKTLERLGMDQICMGVGISLLLIR